MTKAPKFKYRLKQLLWTQHPVYGWVQGRVQQKWVFQDYEVQRLMYRITVLNPDGSVRMLHTGREEQYHVTVPE